MILTREQIDKIWATNKITTKNEYDLVETARAYHDLRDGVTGLCDNPHAHYSDARRWVAVDDLRAVVARVEENNG